MTITSYSFCNSILSIFLFSSFFLFLYFFLFFLLFSFLDSFIKSFLSFLNLFFDFFFCFLPNNISSCKPFHWPSQVFSNLFLVSCCSDLSMGLSTIDKPTCSPPILVFIFSLPFSISSSFFFCGV